ncbi:cytochrome P450 [Microbacterium lacus]
MHDPYPIYRSLRSEHPVAWSDSWNAWVISRHADVAKSLRDGENLSNEDRQGLLFDGLTADERAALEPLRHYFAQKDVIGSDAPDHTRMRRLVQSAFTPQIITGLTPRIEALVGELLADVADLERFDLVDSVTHPLPVVLIAEVLGVPSEDRDLFKRWSADILAFQGTGTTTFAAASTSQNALLEMFAYMSEIIDARRLSPRDDLITALAQAEDEGGRLTRDELLSTCNTILTAGHETTTNFLGSMVFHLLDDPERWRSARGNPALRALAAEETLRFDAPKQRNFRRVKRDHVFEGVEFAENEMVFQLIGSANRDPAKFENPDVFEIERDPKGHVTFGNGIHFCLGAPLAKLEGRIMLEALFDAFPSPEIDPPSIEWQERVQFRGPARLELSVR